jgi:hypothetical protein
VSSRKLKNDTKKTALCKQCHEKEAEMTSFECYNMRVANPKAYLVFYDNFLKIAAGQAVNATICGRTTDELRTADKLLMVQ